MHVVEVPGAPGVEVRDVGHHGAREADGQALVPGDIVVLADADLSLVVAVGLHRPALQMPVVRGIPPAGRIGELVHVAAGDWEVRGNAGLVVEIRRQGSGGRLQDIRVGQEKKAHGAVDATLGLGALDGPVVFVHEEDVAVGGGAQGLAPVALAPAAAVQHPRVHDPGVLVTAFCEVLHRVLHPLGHRMRVRCAEVVAAVAVDLVAALAVDEGIPLGVGLKVRELSVGVGISEEGIRDGVRVGGLSLVACEARVVVRVGVVRVEVVAGEDMTAAHEHDPELVQEGLVVLLHAPVVHAIAGHPEDELVIPAVLPGVEAAGIEGRGLGDVKLRQARQLDGGNFLVHLSGSVPAHTQAMEEVVCAVERAHPSATGDREHSPAIVVG